MIVLDTHIWVWWVHDEERLSDEQVSAIRANEAGTIGIPAISCWEVAKLVEYGRLELPLSLEQWFAAALRYPGLRLVPLSPEVAVESTRLPGDFHRDPADQLIVATARVHDCPLITMDGRILRYAHVQTVG